MEWVVEDFLQEMPERASVSIEGRTVHLRAWKYECKGLTGFCVPVYLLYTDLPENSDYDRTLTHYLYGGDQSYRFCQEVILGIGGVRMLRALGFHSIERFHMNEGHASLLGLELLDEEARRASRSACIRQDIETVRKKCVFTTHTPVPAGHDQFPIDMVRRILGPREDFFDLKDVFCVDWLSHVLGDPERIGNVSELVQRGIHLNMTYLALNLSHYVNGVAKKHGEVSRLMFAGYSIDAITNGVHAATWTCEPFQALYDRNIPGWRADNFNLRYALNIPKPEIWSAHSMAKRELIRLVNRETNAGMDVDLLTIGFARRAATYKRADLVFANMDRLRNIAANTGPIQLVFAGKAHPQDHAGKELIQRVFQARGALKKEIKVAYLQNYDIELGRLVTSGVDVWLNTPQPPNEASGTSGMKAALNGIPSLSVLDGWWIEGHIPGLTGWAIGHDRREVTSGSWESDADSIYNLLEHEVIPMFYRDRDRFIDIMRHSIALNGSFFNTQRMVLQYVLRAYFG